RYLTEDYGLSYYAAFAGCAAETEASFETIAFLTDKTDELNLGSILIIEGSGQKLAQTVINNTKDKKLQILTMDSMQAITSADIRNGVTYLSIMKENLEVLKKALE
ncbi:MAG: zinc ABC transporter substrate-binding protein, partial [Lachnospiraceae bacterium]|nr:zinc ABC transporter substrate-binding protein [Lachnospiraceae bacterium]